MRCLLIEDYTPLRQSMGECLRHAGFIVDESRTGDEGLWSAKNHDYGVIVLDIMLPGLDGMAILRELRRSRDKTPILMISARDAVASRVEGLDSGADDYLVKPFDLQELVARVRALSRRKFDNETSEIRVGDLHVDGLRKRVTRAGREIQLTRLEYKLIHYLAQRAGQPVSRQEIGAHVYEDGGGDGGTNKIDVCINCLRKKLNAPGEADLISTRRGFGYMLEGQGE
ncbi:response regulator transcription factor [Luteolibacter flavescens]|uniref:Response regulator transcription factor n=1 Tax=Luteolibacter flavescens TaxID=1859460 RepID=A0ABT3FVE0_9BACT|nr:response regulator transcription factor [Luteolibacter flavescens]MCW1887551.1 response regulator transcription factor [Luteolibacter flavescens]